MGAATQLISIPPDFSWGNGMSEYTGTYGSFWMRQSLRVRYTGEATLRSGTTFLGVNLYGIYIVLMIQRWPSQACDERGSRRNSRITIGEVLLENRRENRRERRSTARVASSGNRQAGVNG